MSVTTGGLTRELVRDVGCLHLASVCVLGGRHETKKGEVSSNLVRGRCVLGWGGFAISGSRVV